MPRSARPLAIACRNACCMPAPAPWASTSNACACGARCRIAGTRVAPSTSTSTSRVSVAESEAVTRRVCARACARANAALLHFRRAGIVVLTVSLGALLGLLELRLFIRPHLGSLADLRLALRRVDELALGFVEL